MLIDKRETAKKQQLPRAPNIKIDTVLKMKRYNDIEMKCAKWVAS